MAKKVMLLISAVISSVITIGSFFWAIFKYGLWHEPIFIFLVFSSITAAVLKKLDKLSA